MAKAKQSLERGGKRHGHSHESHQRESHAPLAQIASLAPFSMMNRFAEEMERIFDDFGLGHSWFGQRAGSESGHAAMWSPQMEIFERGGQFIVRADLPGLSKEDVKVDITEDALTIQGERKHEHEEEREGFHRSERSYGSFYRCIPLPEGINAEEAKANFKDGVLEISIPAPQHESRHRQIPIS
ncbi:MAG: Hsp20/alpha crystallin family protein [Blastocatellia bacterium]|nr:Hsp20/alpha crystallin family protein [Blastocatellia bacterium]